MLKKYNKINKNTIINFFITLLILCSTIIFWQGFMRGSDFKWTVEQINYWEAVVELFFLAIVFFVILMQNIKKQAKLFLLVISIGVFAFLHSIIWCLIVGLLYVIFTCLLGFMVCNLFKIDKSIHTTFFVGFISVISLVAFLSLLGIGTPFYLRRVMGMLFVIIVFLMRQKIIECCKNILQKVDKVENNRDNILITFMSIIIFICICCLLGKANFCYGYDSLWYGLRSEYVLAPFKGVYDDIKLIACVHTYPKGFEFYTLVFAGLSSYSFIISINIIIWIMTGITLLEILYEMNVGRKYSIAMLMLFYLTPSITNLVNTAKPDLLSIYFQTVSLLYAVRAVKKKDNTNWIISFSILIMTFAIKPTSILFSTALGFVFLIFKILNRSSNIKRGYCFLIFPFVGSIVVYARTVKLTGIPMTSLVVSLFTKIGFKIKYPYILESVRVTSLRDFFQKDFFIARLYRLLKLFFCPNNSSLCTTEITWWGILFTISWIIAVIVFVINIKKHFMQCKRGEIEGIICLSFAIVSGLSICSMMLLEFPDGNYYMLMQIITYIYLGMESKNIFTKIRIYLFLPLIVCNILLSVAISCAWSVGFTPISVSDCGYYNHVEKYKKVTANNYGIRQLYDFMLQNDDKRTLIISYREDELFILPGITENYIHQKTWGNYVFASDEKLYEYATKTNINYFLVEDSMMESDENISSIIKNLVEKSELNIEFEADGFKLYQVVVK